MSVDGASAAGGSLRTVGVTAADQVLSSVTNLIVFVVAAWFLAVRDLDAFSLGSSLFAVALGAARTTSSERIAGRAASAVSIVTSSWVAIGVGFIVGVVILAVAFRPGGLLLWAAIGPVVLSQDRVRYIALRHRPSAAVASDATWLCCLVASAAVSSRLDDGVVFTLAMVGAPLAGLAVAIIGVRRHVRWRLERDWHLTRAELPYVWDGWLLAATVFVVMTVLAARSTPSEVSNLRMLFLTFQPLYSLGYVGRWHVLRSVGSKAAASWPRRLTALTTLYCLLAAGGLVGLQRWRPEAVGASVGWASYVVFAAGQIGRSWHQGLVDMARGASGNAMIDARVGFALVCVVIGTPLAYLAGTFGATVSLALGFLLGAVLAHKASRRWPTEPRRHA